MISIKAGTGVEVQNFFLRHKVCSTKTLCPSDLGCGALRSWCVVDLPFPSVEWKGTRQAELHFVDAPHLNDLDGSVGRWIETFNSLNGNMTMFNGFMHNKVALYASSTVFAQIDASLRNASVAALRRTSLDTEGSRVMHIGFSIGGRIFEIVGKAKSILNTDLAQPWTPMECPGAHALIKPLSAYAALDNDRANPTMLVHVSMTSPDLHSPAMRVLTGHLTAITGAVVAVHGGVGSCSWLNLHWSSMPGLIVRYVKNKAGLIPGLLAAYDSNISNVHTQFSGPAKGHNASTSSDWWGHWWDHWLDQHIGIWYGGGIVDCTDRAVMARQSLLDAAIPVAARAETDANLYYAGYAGPMAWEYQWQNCDANISMAPAECACDPSNIWADRQPCPKKNDTDWCHGV